MTTIDAPRRPLPEAAAAADRLTHLGFVLVSPFPPGSGDTELLVSLRGVETRQRRLEEITAEELKFVSG
jgi:hypothetical protein